MDLGIGGAHETNPPGMMRDDCTRGSLGVLKSIFSIFPISFSPGEVGTGWGEHEMSQ